jgi:hypothetical protein
VGADGELIVDTVELGRRQIGDKDGCQSLLWLPYGDVEDHVGGDVSCSLLFWRSGKVSLDETRVILLQLAGVDGADMDQLGGLITLYQHDQIRWL